MILTTFNAVQHTVSVIRLHLFCLTEIPNPAYNRDVFIYLCDHVCNVWPLTVAQMQNRSIFCRDNNWAERGNNAWKILNITVNVIHHLSVIQRIVLINLMVTCTYPYRIQSNMGSILERSGRLICLRISRRDTHTSMSTTELLFVRHSRSPRLKCSNCYTNTGTLFRSDTVSLPKALERYYQVTCSLI